MPRPLRQSFWRRLIGSRMTIIACSLIVLFALVSFARGFYRRLEVRQEIDRLEQQVSSLRTQKTDLTNLIEYFQSPLFQEQEAREKLGLAKPGESVVIVPLTNGSVSSLAGEQQAFSAENQTANPVKWLNYFFSSSSQTESSPS
ncbi:MAG: septum formation initiator family protein [bacterium]